MEDCKEFFRTLYLHIHLRYIFEATCKFYFSFFLFLSIVVNILGALMFGVLYCHQYIFDMVIYGFFFEILGFVMAKSLVAQLAPPSVSN